MCDYIGVFTVSELEAESETTWCGIGICVGDVGDAGGVGEARPDWGAGPSEVRCFGERCSLWGRCECSAKNNTLCVGYTLTVRLKYTLCGVLRE